MAIHKPGIAFLVWFTFIILLLSLLVNYAASGQLDIFPDGWYMSTTGNVSDKFSYTLTPSGWTFSIWIFIYLAQVAWMIYALTLVCRKTNDWQGYLYWHPGHMSYIMYLFYIMAQIFNVAWIFTFDRSMINAAGGILWAITVSLYVCIGLSYSSLYKKGKRLIELGHNTDIILVRLFVQNGLAMYATWVTIASNLNIGFILVYTFGLTQELSGTIILAALAAEIILFYGLDWTVLDKFSRYTFTPYIVIIVALIGSIDKNWMAGARNSIFTACLLGVGSIGLLVKIIVVAQASRKNREPIIQAKNW